MSFQVAQLRFALHTLARMVRRGIQRHRVDPHAVQVCAFPSKEICLKRKCYEKLTSIPSANANYAETTGVDL